MGSEMCIRDSYLRIVSNTYDVIRTFCGQHTGMSLRVAGNYALLTFHTGRRVQKNGFELLFSYRVFPGELRFVAFHSIATSFGNSCLKRQ